MLKKIDMHHTKFDKWIKNPRFYLIVSLLSLVIISIFVSVTLNKTSKNSLEFNGSSTILYQVDTNYPPYSYVHEGKLVGFDFYLTNIIFPTNFTINYSNDTWANVYQRISNGEIDIAGIIAISDLREEDILFSNTVFTSSVAVYARTDEVINSLDDLKGLNVGVGKGYYTEAILRDELKLTYIPYTDIYLALLDLEQGKIDVIFENDQLIETLLIKHELTGKIAAKLTHLYPREHAYAISKLRPELVEFINQRIDTIEKSGVFEEIYLNYFFEHSDGYIRRQNQATLIWSISIILGLAFIFLVLQVIIRRLRADLGQKIDELEQSNLELIDRYAEIRILAYTNDVTGLANYNRLRHDLTTMISTSQARLVIMMVEIERFNEVNDAFGHRIGDLVLQEVTKRLISILPPVGKIYNINSPQFVIIGLPTDREFFTTKAAEINKSIRLPINVEDKLIHLNANLGIVFYPEHGNTFDELLSNADIALVDSRKNHKGDFTLFDEEMGFLFHARLDMHKQMRHAIDNNEFELYYQPIVTTVEKTLIGFEALLRFNHPTNGVQAPILFIDVLEESRLILPLGYWIIKEACLFIMAINKRSGSDYTVSINISSIQLLNEAFIQTVTEIIDEIKCDVKHIVFEVTESVALKDINLSIERLYALRSLGIRIAIDDFGTGYSSLSYIKDLPIDFIKIDKSFVQTLHSSTKNQLLAQSIISIGHSFGLILVAEGVETEEQHQFLIDNGCDRIQGYLISKPKPVKDIYKTMIT